uniref:Uncharacterized protein n=1 Tax=uncultured marine virus TaxID=186617 RepID=A0A0F7L2S3_9VIRU|nr:hypothetical protein [uncultured marine virus]
MTNNADRFGGMSFPCRTSFTSLASIRRKARSGTGALAMWTFLAGIPTSTLPV